MSKLLVVFGATGHQGSSVIDFVINDPELSQQYKLRAITRDVTSDKIKHLQESRKDIEVIQADISDRSSLEYALTGAHYVFAMTTPSFGPDSLDVELNSAKRIADVAVEKGVEYFIFSTLPSVMELSGGKYTKVAPFDEKAKAEAYIRGLPMKSAFYSPGSFLENFHSPTFLGPQKAADGTWVLTRANSPRSKLPFINAAGDTGKFVGSILAEPDKYEGKRLCAAAGMWTYDDVVAAMSKFSGKTVLYKQVSVEKFKEMVQFGADIFAEALAYPEEYGYYGKDTEDSVSWAVQQARGNLITLEQHFEKHPLRLE